MPYTEKQKKLFRAAAHDKDIAKNNNMTQQKAKELMKEGDKTKTKPPVKSK